MKQRAHVLLTLCSASFLLACLSMLFGPVLAYALTNQHTSTPVHTASGPKHDDDVDDKLLPMRHSHFTLHTEGNSSNLGYGGGPVMTGTTHTYAIFWEPNGNVDAHYNSLINRFFDDVGSSPTYQLMHQYTQSNGQSPTNSVVGGSWVDQHAYPRQTLLDSDIQNEVKHAQQVNGWQSSLHNVFFVFTERNTNICIDSSQQQCTGNAFCAYHSAPSDNTTIYALIPYIASFNCDPNSNPNNDDADKSITGVSHELLEAVTDPLGNAWLDSQGSEVADKCETTYGPANAQGADVVWNGHPYMIQEEWDNQTSSCRLAPASSTTPTPTPTPPTPTPTPPITTPTPTPTPPTTIPTPPTTQPVSICDILNNLGLIGDINNPFNPCNPNNPYNIRNVYVPYGPGSPYGW